MAREYEVRQEYENYGLGQLMDSTITCFQGMGDIQAEMLKQYFKIATIREMANFPFFLWALAIQEAAMDGGQAGRPASEIAGGADARFKVREEYKHFTPVELMNAPIHALEGLTPAQDLALYDIFRITNIIHLAHNRIMLESRVIQVLESQGGAEAAAAGGGDEVDHVLGRRAQASSAVQRITESRRAGRDERLHALEQETTEHIRSRLDTLRERAKDRAGSLPSREGGGRLVAIQQTKQRAEASGRMGELASVSRGGVAERRSVAVTGRRTTTVATVGRAGAAGVGAGPVRGLAATRGLEDRTAAGARGVSSREDRTASMSTSRAAAVSATRGGQFRGGGGGGGGGYRAGGGGGGGGGGSSTATATRTTTTQTTSTKVTSGTAAGAAAGAAAAGAGATATTPRKPPARGGFQPWMAAAAVVAVLLLALLIWFTLRPASAPPTGGQTAATGGSVGGTQPGTQTGAPGQVGAAGTAGQAATTATPGGAKPEVAIRTTHEVKAGQSLWRISRIYYELGSQWRKIFNANQDRIKNPDLIYPKQKFKIPQ